MMDVIAVIDSDIAYASDTSANITMQPGGVAANTAAWMAINRQPVTLVGCVGDDEFGAGIRSVLDRAGVDVRLQTTTARPTGTCVVIVDRRRERTMFPDSGANAHLVIEPLREIITADSHVHLSGYTLMNPATSAAGLAVLDLAVAAGASRSLDPASAAPLRAHLPMFLDLLPRFQVLLANENEAAVLSGREDPHEALDELIDLVPTVVVKVGPRGVLARDTMGHVAEPAPRQDVVDTTGAGDAFTAGFLPSWLSGATLASAVSEGQRLASLAVGRVGAGPLVG